MDRLSGFVRRRRKLVLAVWVLLLLVSVPFASRQTENLTGGGFEVPGSGSVAVESEIDRFQGAGSESLGVVLENRGGDLAAAVDRVGAAAATIDGIELSDAVAAQAKGSSEQVVLLPLEVSGGVKPEDLPAVAATGADYVAMGALTHSAGAADLHLKLEPLP